jgi:hypothetical protein
MWELAPQPVTARAPTEALLPALSRLGQLLHAVSEGTPGPARIVAGPPEEPPSRLTQLGDAIGLEPFDLDLLALALAQELDRRYGTLVAALAENPFATRPTPEVALALLCPSAGERIARKGRLSGSSPLVALELGRLAPFGPAGATGTTTVELAPRVLDHPFDAVASEPRLAGVARTVRVTRATPTPWLSPRSTPRS